MYNKYVVLGKSVCLSVKEEIIVYETIADIVEKDDLKILAFNICDDHMLIILVCEDEKENQLNNTIKHILNNRIKHNLPKFNSSVLEIFNRIICTYKYADYSEYFI